MEKLSLPIMALLDKNHELLEQGESKPRAISFNMWMIGSCPSSAVPTIVFSSRSRRQRTYAKSLLKESKLLDDYPGVRIKTLDKVPAIYQVSSEVPAIYKTSEGMSGTVIGRTSDASVDMVDDLPEIRASEPVSGTVISRNSDGSIYMVDGSRGMCGALIAFGSSKIATMGGILIINGIHYGISVQHALPDTAHEPDEDTDKDHVPSFDDDSDSESHEFVDVTSKGSISSDSEREAIIGPFESSLPGNDSDGSDNARLEAQHCSDAHDKERQAKRRCVNRQETPTVLGVDFAANDLDYQVFRLDDTQFHSLNSIRLPAEECPSHINPRHVMRVSAESKVWAATGPTGCVKGAIMKNPYFIKMELSRTFQEMWAVRLERRTMPGDCGSWVIDATTGGIYGHIVGGDPMLDLAFIIPAYKIFDDLQRRFGTTPLLLTEQTAMLSSSLVGIDSFPGKYLNLGPTERSPLSPTMENMLSVTNMVASSSSVSYPDLIGRLPLRVQPEFDTSGQVAPPSMKPRITATLWEDEGCICFQVDANGVCVARRDDNHMINGTKLLNVAGLTRGRRDGILKSEKTRHIVKIGPGHLKGVWIPFDRALDLANKEKITESLYPLFVHNIGALLYNPTNQSRTNAEMAANDRRRLDNPKQQDSSADTIDSQSHSSVPYPGAGRPGLDRTHPFPTPPTSASSIALGLSNQGGGYDSGHQSTERPPHSIPVTPATTPPRALSPNPQPYQSHLQTASSRSMLSVAAPQQTASATDQNPWHHIPPSKLCE